MTYLIIGFLLSVGAGIVAFIDKKEANKENQKSNKFNTLAFAVLIIGAFTSLWSGYNSQKSGDKAQHRADSVSRVIINKQKVIDSINRLLYAKQDDIIKLQKNQIDTSSRILSTSLKTNLLQQQIGQLQSELKSEITGGKSKPILLLTVSRIVIDNNTQKKYFVLFFDILNNSDYALQNVKAIIYDTYGIDMRMYGVQYVRDGLSEKTVKPDIKDYNSTNHFDGIGSISKGSKYPLYITTFCPELAKNRSLGYPIEINWFNGHFTYFINLKIEGETLNLDSVQLVYNGTRINYNKYFNFLKFK
ncbi:hypothetical protein [Mucilaginibacter sp.]|uniref:hypothetical protein n=1 Tax=Mucilaginibacter sp. TaxID=1882438 RepID=UPI00261AF873|nr:hypothetical protein [Mucilaginibacter sp.]MDB5030355.1 hypothetical protein [Mucilaginibacter sp.]